jgi:RNA polymerase sigma factor (sigma-70 family)
MNDAQLLHQYVAERSHEAFAELVRRHVDHVYSAALRQTGRDSDAAEEVTQRVFILLANKAESLDRDPEVLLGGWLFNAVRYIARDVLRKEERRARHEQKAAEMAHAGRGSPRHAAAQPADPEWKEVEAELDDAMSHLGPRTRGVLVLRFFEGKTAREVAEQLGISEEAARKRVSRAVDELRELFLRRGVVLSAATLTDGLTTIATLKAPAGLAASAASAASAATSASTATAAAITGGAIMASAKLKTAALIAAVVLLTGGAVAVAPKFFSPTRGRTVNLAKTGPSITGTVRGPDGMPASAAEIVVGSPGRQAYAYDGARPRIDALADSSGKFTVAKPAEPPYMLVVRSPAGYAELSWKALQAAGADVTLQPWGRIEGIAREGDKPLAKTIVRLWRVQSGSDPNERLIHHETEVTTDAAGKFVFPRVAPGEAWIYRELFTKLRGYSLGWQYVQVQPGQTAQIAMGGSGRTVTGRVEVPPDMASFVMWKEDGKYRYSAEVRRDLPTTRATHAPDETPEQYRAAEEAFGRTPEGKMYNQWMFGHDFLINPDGTFAVHDLPPGKYKINIRNFESIEEVRFSEDIARGEASFEIPASAASASVEPIEIGKVTFTAIPRLHPGAAGAGYRRHDARRQALAARRAQGQGLRSRLLGRVRRPLGRWPVLRSWRGSTGRIRVSRSSAASPPRRRTRRATTSRS